MPRKLTFACIKTLAVLGLVLCLGSISAQSPQPDCMAGALAGPPAVWLEGNRRPMFGPENDQGMVADSLWLENISLTFKPTASQQAELTALLAEQQRSEEHTSE